MDAPALSVRHYGASPGSHAHAHFQILIGLEGTLELEVQGRGQRVTAGHGLVIAPEDRHDFEARTGARCLVLDATDAAWSPWAGKAVKLPHLWPLAQHLAHACERGLEGARRWGPELLREAWPPGPAPLPASRPRRSIDWAALQRWAQARLDTELTVADLARQVHLGAAQFAERCLGEQGLTPMAWLRHLRFARARYLRALGLPVAEVARRCGYRSPSALTAALRRGH
jgi:AraC-like DNA-binding protein